MVVFNAILEMLIIGSAAIVIIAAGKAMLTRHVEKNMEKISYMKFIAITAMGVCVCAAYLRAALGL